MDTENLNFQILQIEMKIKRLQAQKDFYEKIIREDREREELFKDFPSKRSHES